MMEIPSTVYTHAGKFHADDVFSTALLRLLRPELKVIRTAALPENFEGFAFDIGWGAYDHHQKDAPVRENGVPYAAFGLLWKDLGEQLVGEEWQRFDEHFIQPLDLEDNTGCGHPLAAAIASFNPLWDSQEDPNENFERAVTVAAAMLERRIAEVNGIRRAKAVVEQAIEQMQDGIVVLVAKMHQTGALNSHQILVMPTQTMREEDRDYAVAFSVPADDPSILYIYGRQASDTRKLEGSDIDVGNSQYGGVELLVVFDDVFIPNENIYMNGESEFATVMVERFAGYHRQSYGGCKVGVGDVLLGAAAVAADYNGVAKASHIKDKLIEMIHLNETMYSCGIACSAEGTQTASGNYLINLLLANVCKQNVTRFPYEMARIAEDLAGGAVGTCLSEADLHGEFTGPWVEKYMKNGTGTTAENRMRILRLIENLSLGAGAVGYRTESLHGAGSPQAQRVMIARQGDIAGKKVLAKRIAKVKED